MQSLIQTGVYRLPFAHAYSMRSCMLLISIKIYDVIGNHGKKHLLNKCKNSDVQKPMINQLLTFQCTKLVSDWFVCQGCNQDRALEVEFLLSAGKFRHISFFRAQLQLCTCVCKQMCSFVRINKRCMRVALHCHYFSKAPPACIQGQNKHTHPSIESTSYLALPLSLGQKENQRHTCCHYARQQVRRKC